MNKMNNDLHSFHTKCCSLIESRNSVDDYFMFTNDSLYNALSELDTIMNVANVPDKAELNKGDIANDISGILTYIHGKYETIITYRTKKCLGRDTHIKMTNLQHDIGTHINSYTRCLWDKQWQ